jgi:hypothetical protein
MPQVSPDDFDRLLSSIDLFLSANITATTLGRAVAAGVPIMVVQNSCGGQTAVEVEAMAGSTLSASLRSWLEKVAPLYPFSVWPLGYAQFLKPLLRDNPFHEALNIFELLDEQGLVEACWQLLFDTAVRAKAIARQRGYEAQVHRLPTATQLIEGYLN